MLCFFYCIVLEAVCSAMAEGLEERKVEKIDNPEEKEQAEGEAPARRRRVRRNEAPAAAPAEAPKAEEKAADAE